MKKEIVAMLKTDNLLKAFFEVDREYMPLSEVASWDNVESLRCPHCNTYARLDEASVEELCIPSSSAYFCEDDKPFMEYCYECGGRVLYPPMKKFRGVLRCKSFKLS